MNSKKHVENIINNIKVLGEIKVQKLPTKIYFRGEDIEINQKLVSFRIKNFEELDYIIDLDEFKHIQVFYTEEKDFIKKIDLEDKYLKY